MDKDPELSLAAAALARRLPEEWSAFEQAFKKYSDHRTNECLASPVDILPVTQGRAQLASALLRLFQTCRKTAAEIEDKKK